MNINRENYTKSLENIRPSEKFLAETKKLMLEEAAKAPKAEKPRRRPLIMKITPFAAAAACIAVIAAVSVNILNGRDVENVQFSEENAAAAEISSAVTEEAADEAAPDPDEDTAGDEAFIAAENFAEDSTADVGTIAPAEETEPNESALFAVGGSAVSGDESFEAEEDTLSDENAYPESAAEAEDTVKYHTNYFNDSFDEEANPNADGNDTDGNNAGSDDYFIESDDDIEDSGDDTAEKDALIAPAFTRLSGGKAAAYPDFSPTDTAKLREFLALVSQDDINAEVTGQDGENADVFGEKALALNSAFANAAEKLTPSSEKSFSPIYSFSFFDNVSGDVLYTVQTDGENLSVRIKNGETVYFTADKSVIDGIIINA